MSALGAADIWALKYGLILHVVDEVAEAILELGIETKELFLLDKIGERAYPAELAERLRWPKATIAFTVKRLEEKGFLKRELDTEDLRRHRLNLSPAGRKVTTRGMKLLINAFEQRLARLTKAEQAALGAMLEKMS